MQLLATGTITEQAVQGTAEVISQLLRAAHALKDQLPPGHVSCSTKQPGLPVGYGTVTWVIL